MIKKFWVGVGILLSIYLVLPGPKLPPPNLIESAKSDLPGDTVQISNTSGYFTNLEREKIINFYYDYFSKSSFLNIPLPTYKLNHPPEYARQIWVDTKQSYYLEEIVHPFRESLYVNGFNWKKDVFTPKSQRKQNKLIYKNKVWDTKVSLRWFQTNVFIRLIIFWIIWSSLFFVLKLLIPEIKKFMILFVEQFFKKT